MHKSPFIIRGHVIQDTRVDVDGMEATSVRDKFKSFDELQAKVHRYEELEFVKLCIRDSRIVTAAKKPVRRYLCSQIKYYEITYACIHGGKKFKPRGNGKRATS